jgi:dipeptidyl aminopeptidase/acylaminoacyl peptidase
MKTSAPFGSWDSSVTVDFVAGKDRALSPSLQVDGDDLYFIESRPDEGGRQVLMRRGPSGAVEAVVPADFNVRTRYLEYGGSSFLVSEGRVFFVNFADQQVYSCRAGEAPTRLTNDPSSRFADLVADKKRGRLIALREVPAKPESRNTICAIDLADGRVTDLIAGCDFYSSPRLNASGSRILWVSWNHPNMAWNGTELWQAELSEGGSVGEPLKVAGDSSHGVCQPRWLGEEEIVFVAELGEWFNLYRFQNGKIANLYPLEAEFAYPDWTPGQKQYGIAGRSICASFLSNGMARILLLEGEEAQVLSSIFSSVSCVEPGRDGFYAVVTYPDRPPAIVRLSRQGECSELYSSYRLPLSPEEISEPEAIEFPVDGGSGHAWFYAPKNPRFSGLQDEKPPLVVMCHGGPTAMSPGDFRKGVQFWTSRGYAVVDVNYGGSTGYGRSYRERLRGQWGKVDVSDCIAVVRYLAGRNQIDPKRVAIRGGSAGGYTTLAALTFTKGVISVGASYFGVSDLTLLAKETHKLESRYLDQLVGPYPEAKALYEERSPLAHVEQLSCPTIFFQGDEDRVVPPNQSQLMHESLRAKGIDSEYHLYPGEGHGFRRAETIQHSLKAEHGFYAKFFGFELCAKDRV